MVEVAGATLPWQEGVVTKAQDVIKIEIIVVIIGVLHQIAVKNDIGVVAVCPCADTIHIHPIVTAFNMVPDKADAVKHDIVAGFVHRIVGAAGDSCA